METGKQKPTIAELIRITAIAWASGRFTEDAIILSLKSDYGLNDEDVNIVLSGCVVLQKGLTDSLTNLAGHKEKQTYKSVNEVVLN